MKYLPKVLVLKDLVPRALGFWGWLDHVGSDFTNVLIHIWVQSLLGYISGTRGNLMYFIPESFLCLAVPQGEQLCFALPRPSMMDCEPK